VIGNVLVQTQTGGLKTYKVCDFGLSRSVNRGRFSATTTTTTTNIPTETTEVATSRVGTVNDGSVGRNKDAGGKADGDGGSGKEEEDPPESSGSSDGQQSNSNTRRRCHRPNAQTLTNSMTGGLGKTVWCGVAWCGMEWRGVAWRGVEWNGVAKWWVSGWGDDM
jgi:hypothetical protein